MRRIMMALAAVGMVVGLAGSAAQAHDYRWGYWPGYYGWHQQQWRARAWNRYEHDRHQERMAAIISSSVAHLMGNLSHR